MLLALVQSTILTKSKFPRITVMLDRGDNLELTPACQTKLTSAMTSENADLMKEFLEDYGKIYFSSL